MGRKSVVHQYNMFESSASMGANNTSSTVNLESSDKATIHITWTAGPVGTFALQARNGSKASSNRVLYDDAWFEVDLGSSMTITGADAELMIQLNEAPGTEIRLVYTRSSGTASDLKALISMKTVGA